MLSFQEMKSHVRLGISLLEYSRFKRRLEEAQPGSAKDTGKPHVLVVKLDGIGDYVIFSRISSVFRRSHPDAHIILLCRCETAELARANEFFDEVVALDIVRFERDRRYRLSAARGLLSTDYSAVYQPAYTKSFWTEALVRSMAESEKVTIEGAAAPPGLHRWCLSSYSTVFDNPRPPLREWRVYEAFAKQLLPAHEPERPRLWLEEDGEFANGLVRSGALPEGPYCVLFPGARRPVRRWPTKKWVELARSLLTAPEISLVLAGARADVPQNNDILNGLKNESRVHDVTGQTTLRQLANIVSRARCLVGTETSAVHIAAFCGVPNVCIMGGGHWKRFYPYGDRERNLAIAVPQDCFGCNWNCTKKRPDCVSNVPVRTVLNLLGRFMREAS